MNKAGKILSINPPYAIPGGEVLIECEGIELNDINSFGCYFDGKKAKTVGVSSKRILAIVPDSFASENVKVHIENEGDKSKSAEIIVGRMLAEDIHMVANPAIDPKDDSIVVTRSGTRGQQLPVTLLRLTKDGDLEEMSAFVLNPTGIAFDEHDRLVISNRADGEVCQINLDEEVVPIASELGVATGIAFDKKGTIYVGDRGGTIFRVSGLGVVETWAILEPSVSAYHLAFDATGTLYVSAPSLCSYDSVFRIDESGLDEIFFKGLGRPQGLAFDEEGNLYVAACIKGRHGIVKISSAGDIGEIFVAGMSIVGLCFSRKGEMIVATNHELYSLPLGINGVLLD